MSQPPFNPYGGYMQPPPQQQYPQQPQYGAMIPHQQHYMQQAPQFQPPAPPPPPLVHQPPIKREQIPQQHQPQQHFQPQISHVRSIPQQQQQPPPVPRPGHLAPHHPQQNVPHHQLAHQRSQSSASPTAAAGLPPGVTVTVRNNEASTGISQQQQKLSRLNVTVVSSSNDPNLSTPQQQPPVKKYKPLVRDIDPNSGFDLARVKREPGLLTDDPTALKSFVERSKRPAESSGEDAGPSGEKKAKLSTITFTPVDQEEQDEEDEEELVTLEDEAEEKEISSTNMEEANKQYRHQLKYYRKPYVGRETACMFCLTKCHDRQPQLLACLHSACKECANEAKKTQKKTVEVIDGEEDVFAVRNEAKIACPLCKVQTGESELMDNLFLREIDRNTAANEEGESMHFCQCDEGNEATSWCKDCPEYLCDECVKAHKRLRVTKDHEINPVKRDNDINRRKAAGEVESEGRHNREMHCLKHRSEIIRFFCEPCEELTCQQCHSNEHQYHSHSSIEESAPAVKTALKHALKDVRLRRNILDENKKMLGQKLEEINIKEESLMQQIVDIKQILTDMIEKKFRDLKTQVTRSNAANRRAIETRKITLERFYIQADYALAFMDNGDSSDDDLALLSAKKVIAKQLRRLSKVDTSTGMSSEQKCCNLDIYFQHFGGQSMHSSLDSVLGQVLQDIKVLSEKPAPPTTQTTPRPPLQTPPRQYPPLVKPARNPQVNSSPVRRGSLRGSPTLRGSSTRGAMDRSLSGKVIINSRGRSAVLRTPVVRGQQLRGRGVPNVAPPALRARGRGRATTIRPQMNQQQQSSPYFQAAYGQQQQQRQSSHPPTPPQQTSLSIQQQIQRQKEQRLQQQQQQHQIPSWHSPAIPQLPSSAIANNAPDNSFKITIPSKSPNGEIIPVDKDGAPLMRQQQQQPQQHPQRPNLPSGIQIQPIPSTSKPNPIPLPPKQNLTSQPIPSLSKQDPYSHPIPSTSKGIPASINVTKTTVILSEPKSPIKPTVNQTDGSGFAEDLPDLTSILDSTDEEEGEKDKSLDIDEKNVCKIGAKSPEKSLTSPINSPLQDEKSPGDNNAVKINLGTLIKDKRKSEDLGKCEQVDEQQRQESDQVHLDEEAQGDEAVAIEETRSEEYCALCHDGGQLYCCDRCPKVYHLYCYIPPLTEEPPDDWVCIFCATFHEINQFPNAPNKGFIMGDRDVKVCRRILFELYNHWPQSVPFREAKDLNFPEYQERVERPMAFDLIKERLCVESHEQYECLEEFVVDLRLVFKNCYTFHKKDSDFYKHAKYMEENLEKLLEVWRPDLAYDENINVDLAKKEAKLKLKKKKKHKKKHKKKKKVESEEEEFSSELSEGEKLDNLSRLEDKLSRKHQDDVYDFSSEEEGDGDADNE